MAKTYSEKLRSPLWQRFRLEVMQRDDFKCTRCKSGATFLHVHHTKYIKGREPWEYDLSLMETLCEVCHGITHTQIGPANKEHIAMLNAVNADAKSYLTATQTHIDILMNTLRSGVPAELEAEILKNIVYLQEKRREYKNG